jgi:ATP-dependent RNA helicase UAP56/SUB2
MTDKKAQLADFEDDTGAGAQPVNVGLGTHAAVALGGFKDFCLKPDLLRAINDNGFEQPSEVQHQVLPQAMLGGDILAQAKAGMGKTAVFVFALLEQIQAPASASDKTEVQAVVVVHARELAYQVEKEFKRFNKYLPYAKTAVVYGGVPEEDNIRALTQDRPAIVVGTPGRLKTLLTKKKLDLSHVKFFVVDEFDRCLDDLRMRRDVQDIFMACPRQKQVLMFSATTTDELRQVALKFMKNGTEILVDSLAKLTLHGLSQYFVELKEAEKLRRLAELLDLIDFNQLIIFTNAVDRAEALNKHLQSMRFPSIAIHSAMDQVDRLKAYDQCKTNQARIIVATDLFGRGIDIDRINVVIQFDMAPDPDTYMHRVGRAGRFGTKGLTIAFLTDDEKKIERLGRTYKDTDVMKAIQERFEVRAKALTDPRAQLSQNLYMQQ